MTQSEKTAITSLPDNLSVGGSLYLQGTAITSLPDNLSVGGYLYLQGTAITSLPDNLSVGDSLYLQGTAITSLPDNLSVGGYLDLRGTAITGAQYDCGNEKRAVAAYRNTQGKTVVSLGCFIGDFEQCKKAINAKYGTGKEAEDYIKKVKAAFDYRSTK